MMAVDDAIKYLYRATKQSDDVIKSTTKNAGLGTFIKNSVNNIASNESAATKTVSRKGREAARRAVENQSARQATQKTTTKVLDNFNMNEATDTAKRVAYTKVKNRPDTSEIRQISENIANSRRTQRVIDGHNARTRQTNIDTIVNNVKDSRGARNIPEGRSRELKSKIDQAVENIQNPPETPRMPIINTTMPNGGPQASPIIRNTPINNTPDAPRYGPYDTGTGGSGGGNNNNNNRTHTSSGPEGGPRNNGNNSNANNNTNTNTNSNTNTNTNTNSGPNTDSGPEPEGFDFRAWGDNIFGGIGDSYKGIRDGGPLWDTIKGAHTNDDGSLRWGRIAGTYMAASAAGRVISGGGLTRDRNGNPDFPGIPFI